MDPIVRLQHVCGVHPASWVRLTRSEVVSDDERRTRCDLEVRVTSYAFVRASPLTVTPPLVIASWDIECYSRTRGFPKATNPDDKVIQIGISFQRFGSTAPFRRVVVCLGPTSDVPGVDIRVVDDEVGMFHEFFDVLLANSADVLVGYNVDQFDYQYVVDRCGLLVDDATACEMVDRTALGRALEGGGVTKSFQLNTGALGQNKFVCMDAPGVWQLDLLQYLRREVKLASYSLGNVSTHYLGDTKNDLSPHQLFENFERGPDERATIAAYCIQDCDLVLRLLDRLAVLPTLIEMACATSVPLSYLVRRGQQIRVFSVIQKKARDLGFVCPDSAALRTEGKYSGATVLEPKVGAYFEIVACMDFASLVSKSLALVHSG